MQDPALRRIHNDINHGCALIVRAIVDGAAMVVCHAVGHDRGTAVRQRRDPGPYRNRPSDTTDMRTAANVYVDIHATVTTTAIDIDVDITAITTSAADIHVHTRVPARGACRPVGTAVNRRTRRMRGVDERQCRYRRPGKPER